MGRFANKASKFSGGKQTPPVGLSKKVVNDPPAGVGKSPYDTEESPDPYDTEESPEETALLIAQLNKGMQLMAKDLERARMKKAKAVAKKAALAFFILREELRIAKLAPLVEEASIDQSEGEEKEEA
jgi:hypothetical protein